MWGEGASAELVYQQIGNYQQSGGVSTVAAIRSGGLFAESGLLAQEGVGDGCVLAAWQLGTF
jgi:hypothetical protein